MIFLQKGELPIRTDKNLKWENLYSNDIFSLRNNLANYTFTSQLENYNRLYHFPEFKAKYTTRQSNQRTVDGIPQTVIDYRTHDNAAVPWYSYVEPGNEGDADGGVKYKMVWSDSKTSYYDWVNNWLFSENNNNENTPCEPPYNDFNNPFCLDIKTIFGTEENAPMIFKCFIGLLPFYCPWTLPPEDNSFVADFAGYTYDIEEDSKYIEPLNKRSDNLNDGFVNIYVMPYIPARFENLYNDGE